MKLFSWFTDANRSASLNNELDNNKENDIQGTKSNTKTLSITNEKSKDQLNEKALINQAMWPTAKTQTTKTQPLVKNSTPVIQQPVSTPTTSIANTKLNSA